LLGVAAGLRVLTGTVENEALASRGAKERAGKITVRTSIGLESLDKLEIDFRATPGLQPYYIKLAG
jgi:hypothetical protein